ncbi:MAG: hypothetical protein IJT27_07850 [Clostridia bacterium]|nr:hypothetical protein [Clostridia bacterium]
MSRTLYSLMLNEDLVREVDRLAHRMGTNRSNMVNSILAEYLHFTTPEQRINEILSGVERLLLPANEFVPFLAPGAMSLSLKSSLEYKYRPTVKYEVQLFRGGGGTLGELHVIFRTQSAGLLSEMAAFFRLWKAVEEPLLSAAGVQPDYALYDGKFTRSIAVPRNEPDTETLADAISGYIRTFDRCMKRCLSGEYDVSDVRREYASYLEKTGLYI